jgi:hypothetical protein
MSMIVATVAVLFAIFIGLTSDLLIVVLPLSFFVGVILGASRVSAENAAENSSRDAEEASHEMLNQQRVSKSSKVESRRSRIE